jgi:HSP20 family molecular chaperone IbpA
MSAQVTVRETNGAAAAPRPLRTVAPAVDIFENAEEILVVADVPGVASGAIEVKVESDTLTLATKQVRQSEARALGREYEVVDFARSFRLPRGIDGANIRAEARDGTLVVRLPKAAASKGRKIPVSAN